MPLRKCVACNGNRAKKDLIRVVRSREGVVDVDITGRLNGRGAYICSNLDCLNEAKKNKKLDRALKEQIPVEVYEKIIDIINIDKQ